MLFFLLLILKKRKKKDQKFENEYETIRPLQY